MEKNTNFCKEESVMIILIVMGFILCGTLVKETTSLGKSFIHKGAGIVRDKCHLD